MADPNTTRTTTGTTGTGTTTQAGYDAEAVRVSPAGTATGTTTTRKDNSSTKGLIVGVLTFLALSLWEWLDGPTGAEGDAITFPEMAIYAVVGIIVGLIVKFIDKALHKDKV